MREVLIKVCDFLEKKLYDAPTYDELYSAMDRMRFKLHEADSEIKRLEEVVNRVLICKR